MHEPRSAHSTGGGRHTARPPHRCADPAPEVVLLGTSNRHTPLDLRERLAFTVAELPAALQSLRRYVPDAAILSTCQRVELYGSTAAPEEARAALARFWSTERQVPIAGTEDHLYFLRGPEAVRHLFSVAAGLDSAVFGEPQILGQVRDALARGRAAGATGAVVGGLLQQAVSVGRRVRSETAIGRNAASVSSVAVELARSVFGDLSSSRVLLVGTGKMGELAAKNLLARGVAGLAVAGRSPDRARQLAVECGSAVALAELEQALPDSDIVISCTSAPHAVIQRDMVERAMRRRAGEPMILVDIAVPRDVEPAASQVPGVRLFNIDDLEAVVSANVSRRRSHARDATRIIDAETRAFQHRLAERRAVPTIVALRQHAERIRQAELRRSASVLGRLDAADRRRVEAMTLALEKKLLHSSIALLRQEAATGRTTHTRALRHLYGLDG